MVDDGQADGGAVRKGGRRQRRQEGGRPHEIKVRLSDEEHEVAAARAAEADVTLARMFREAGLAGDAQTASERRAIAFELIGVRALLGAVSRNLNQLTTVAHATGTADPGQLAATLEAIGRLVERIDAATWPYADLAEGMRATAKARAAGGRDPHADVHAGGEP